MSGSHVTLVLSMQNETAEDGHNFRNEAATCSLSSGNPKVRIHSGGEQVCQGTATWEPADLWETPHEIVLHINMHTYTQTHVFRHVQTPVAPLPPDLPLDVFESSTYDYRCSFSHKTVMSRRWEWSVYESECDWGCRLLKSILNSVVEGPQKKSKSRTHKQEFWNDSLKVTKIFHGCCIYEVKVTTIRNWRSGPPSLCRARFVAPFVIRLYVCICDRLPFSSFRSQEAQVADAGAKTSPDHPDAKTPTPVSRTKVCVLHYSGTPALVRLLFMP